MIIVNSLPFLIYMYSFKDDDAADGISTITLSSLESHVEEEVLMNDEDSNIQIIDVVSGQHSSDQSVSPAGVTSTNHLSS